MQPLHEFYFHHSTSPISREIDSVYDLILHEGNALTKIDFRNTIEGPYRKWFLKKNTLSRISTTDEGPLIRDFLTGSGVTVGNDMEQYQKLTLVDLVAGRYYPRIYRPILGFDKLLFYQDPLEEIKKLRHELNGVRDFLPVQEDIMLSAFNQFSTLIEGLKLVCRTVNPSPTNLTTFGHEIRNLLILACTEVEAQLVGIFESNFEAHQDCEKKKRWTTKDYVKLLPVLKLGEYSVSFTLYPTIDNIAPFAHWNAREPTKSLSWYEAYNAVKHDREGEFSRATLDSLFNAIGAVAILLVAQYGPSVPQWRELISGFLSIKEPFWLYEERYLPPFEGNDWICCRHGT